jgi:hypothetical protein
VIGLAWKGRAVPRLRPAHSPVAPHFRGRLGRLACVAEPRPTHREPSCVTNAQTRKRKVMRPITAKAVATACQAVSIGAWRVMRLPPAHGHTASGEALGRLAQLLGRPGEEAPRQQRDALPALPQGESVRGKTCRR